MGTGTLLPLGPILFLQNNLPLHISPPWTLYSVFHVCFCQPLLSEMPFPTTSVQWKNPSSRVTSAKKTFPEPLNHAFLFSQSPKVISAELPVFVHLLHMSDTHQLPYLHISISPSQNEILSFSFHKWGNWASEGYSNWPKVTELIRDRTLY